MIPTPIPIVRPEAQLLPLPALPITIRPAVRGDLPFIDALQKKQSKAVGFMPTRQLEGKIEAGQILVAEESAEQRVLSAESKSLSPQHSAHSTPLGYLIAQDQYFKRDDVGIIYAINIVPGRQRGLIGASLLKAQFERSAYGCRLYCCWCAQDLAANQFWEAMGFVPLAYRCGGLARRAGGRKKGGGGRSSVGREEADSSPSTAHRPLPTAHRIHIFWQKRIRAGDETTPWWFPSKTGGGSIREDRIVLPIPPDSHWSDARPLILPEAPAETKSESKALPTPVRSKKKAREAPKAVRRNGLSFAIPSQGEPLPMQGEPLPKHSLPEQTTNEPTPAKPKRKCDPRLIAAARELKDRWLERLNAHPATIAPTGKYDVTRLIASAADRTLLESSTALRAA